PRRRHDRRKAGGGREAGPGGEPSRPRHRRRREEPRERFAPAVRGENPRRVGAGTEKRRLSKRDDTGIAKDEIDREREYDRREDLRAQREIIGKQEITGDRSQPRQRLQHAKTVPSGQRVEHGG